MFWTAWARSISKSLSAGLSSLLLKGRQIKIRKKSGFLYGLRSRSYRIILRGKVIGVRMEDKENDKDQYYRKAI